MKTKMTPRLERALKVLYTAFHEGTLNAFRCQACAVGSLLGHGKWIGTYLRLEFPSDFNYADPNAGVKLKGLVKYPVRNMLEPGMHVDNRSGYTLEELSEVEYRFLTEWLKEGSYDGSDKEIQFKGLCAVVEYLCGLDGVENVMELKGLFETDVQGNAKVGIESVLA